MESWDVPCGCPRDGASPSVDDGLLDWAPGSGVSHRALPVKDRRTVGRYAGPATETWLGRGLLQWVALRSTDWRLAKDDNVKSLRSLGDDIQSLSPTQPACPVRTPVPCLQAAILRGKARRSAVWGRLVIADTRNQSVRGGGHAHRGRHVAAAPFT
ncbi:hypothetical protein ACCO45_007171 [Purpureocillium lilacinum]|uniref:Uncharacterized protein n=1 Tax=Purpureocillium lilacinum TaxID=33203 RepID=A0ACC4DTY0_PURLI